MCCFVMTNGNLFAGGSIHQGGDRLSDVSRGRQCAFYETFRFAVRKVVVPRVTSENYGGCDTDRRRRHVFESF